MTSTTERDRLAERITVCDKCFRATCFQGIFMCENARTAGLADIPRVKLLNMGLEHPSYWAGADE